MYERLMGGNGDALGETVPTPERALEIAREFKKLLTDFQEENNRAHVQRLTKQSDDVEKRHRELLEARGQLSADASGAALSVAIKHTEHDLVNLGVQSGVEGEVRYFVASFLESWFFYDIRDAVCREGIEEYDDEGSYSDEAPDEDVDEGYWVFHELLNEYEERGVGDYAEVLQMFRDGELHDRMSFHTDLEAKVSPKLRQYIAADVDALFADAVRMHEELVALLGVVESGNDE